MAIITTPAVTVAARGTIGYAEYRNYPYYPVIRLISLIPKDDKILEPKFLYYCLQGRSYRIPEGGIPQLTSQMIKNEHLRIPLVNEQRRVVEVLEKFEKLIDDVSYGLPAEIEVRQKQYEYYRDKLLTFKRKE